MVNFGFGTREGCCWWSGRSLGWHSDFVVDDGDGVERLVVAVVGCEVVVVAVVVDVDVERACP